MAGFDSVRVVFGLFPHSTKQKQFSSDNFILLREQKMSKRLIVTKSVESRIFSTSSYYGEQQEEEQNVSPGLVMYQVLRSVIRKQQMYPFQLLKQYILFSEQQSSIEVDYKYMRGDLEMVQINIQSVCDLFRQKLVIHGFLTIKHAYEKRLRYDEAYFNEQNLVHIHDSMVNIEQSQKMFLKWQFFGSLYQYNNLKYQAQMKMKRERYYNSEHLAYFRQSIQRFKETIDRLHILESFGKLKEHYKCFKLSKISLSKIEVTNNDFPSKEFDEFQQFLNHKPVGQIEEINSFIIEKHSEHAEESQTQPVEKQVIYEGMKIQKGNGVKSYEFQNQKIASEKSMTHRTPNISNTKDKERLTEELEGKVLVTQKKEGEVIINQGSTHKQHKDLNHSETQQIYLIRESSKKKKRGPPPNFIKIPLTSQNVKIVEIQTERKKRKRETIEERVTMSEKQCLNCRFCEMQRGRRQIMAKVQEKLLSSQTININIVGETSHHYNQEDHELSQRGKRSGHYENRISEFRYQFNEGGNHYQQMVPHHNPGTVMSEQVERGDVASEAIRYNVASTNLQTHSNTRSSTFSHTVNREAVYNKRSGFLGK